MQVRLSAVGVVHISARKRACEACAWVLHESGAEFSLSTVKLRPVAASCNVETRSYRGLYGPSVWMEYIRRESHDVQRQRAV